MNKFIKNRPPHRIASRFLAMACGLIFSSATVAATFTVTKTGDSNDGSCDADCSLREAVIAANTTPGSDTIILPAGTFSLAIAGTLENEAALGDLDLTDTVTISGAGRSSTLIDGGSLDRVFHVRGAIAVNMDNLTLQNGLVDGENGGGMYNEQATVTLTNVGITGNDATNEASADAMGMGGGIYNNGKMTLAGCLIDDNVANLNQSARGDRGGGGIYNAGSGNMTLTTIIVTRNRTVNAVMNTGQFFAAGGGILNTGTMIITDDSLIGSEGQPNQSFNGGGIANLGGFLTLSNTTVSYNIATQLGGGLWAQRQGQNNGKVDIVASTFLYNQANGFDEANGFGRGGAIANTTTPLSISQSTFAYNSAKVDAGALRVDSQDSTYLTNNTFAYNEVNKDQLGENPPVGGAIFARSRINITNNTIFGNRTILSGAPYAGGQLYIQSTERTVDGKPDEPKVTFSNTIVAHDPAAIPAEATDLALYTTNCAGEVKYIASNTSPRGHNLDSGTSCGFTGPGDLSNSDPQMDPAGLQDNGGPTPTIMLQATSPAVNSAYTANCPNVDQRYYGRPDANCDIGAIEVGGSQGAQNLSDLKILMVDDPDPVDRGQQLQYRITITNLGPNTSQGVTLTDALPNDVSIVFAETATGQACAIANNTVSCALGDILNLQSLQVIITVVPGDGLTTLTNTASVAAADPSTDFFTPNNTTSATTTISDSANCPLVGLSCNSDGGDGGGALHPGTLLTLAALVPVIRIARKKKHKI